MNDLFAVAAGWGVIALGVAGLYLFGRDPKADEHDLTDYHPRARTVDDGPAQPVPVLSRAAWPMVDRKAMPARRQLRDVLPPAPAGMDAGAPLYAGMLFDTWHPEDPDVIAARWLREVGEEARAKAGIRPSYATADRDMTGSFPVVRAA